MIAGNSVTHLPEECILEMVLILSSKYGWPNKFAPQVIDFGPEYESVLEFFTERMLGIDDLIPLEKRGLLNKLFDDSGFLKNAPIHDRYGSLVPQQFPV